MNTGIENHTFLKETVFLNKNPFYSEIIRNFATSFSMRKSREF